MSKAAALAARAVAYAMVFINDPGATAPTDDELARVLAGCVRPARPEDYPKIRLEVESWREYGMTRAEVEELADPSVVWSVTRGDLNRIAGRVLSEAETSAAVRAIDQGDVMDLVRSTVERLELGGPCPR